MEWMKDVAIGWSMGLAVIIPGLSAATLALLFGVYGKWLRNLASFRIKPLLPLIGGVGLGVLCGLNLVQWGLAAWPDATSAFFLGTIVVFLFSFTRQNKPRGIFILLCIVAFVFSWHLSILAVGRADYIDGAASGVQMLVAGVVGSTAMALPGISGGTLLIVMGLYYATIDVVAEANWQLISWFAGGTIIGIFAVARLLRVLLDRWRPHVLATLIGLMAGSVRALLPGEWDVLTISALGAGILLSMVILTGRQNWMGEV